MPTESQTAGITAEMLKAGVNAVRERHTISYRHLADLHDDLKVAYRAMRDLDPDLTDFDRLKRILRPLFIGECADAE